MDRLLALRLDQRSTQYDSALYRKLAKLGSDYRQSGTQTLDYYIGDLDTSNDMVNCYGPVSKKEKDRYAPENFIHPMAATEMWTLATFVSQILFGGETARKVEPRNPEDEPKADAINELLVWNDNQQDTYGQGFAWVLDSIVCNRGVMYDHWKDLMEVQMEPVEYEVPYEPEIDPETGRELPKPEDYVPETAIRYRKVRKAIGGFVKVENISPYDFICDPSMPIPRMQEGRFTGHRVMIPWQELERRSKLPPAHYEYVLPETVKRLKTGKSKTSAITGKDKRNNTSRSAFERTRRSQGTNIITGTDKIDKDDGGIVECWPIIIRAIPKTYDIFDDEEQELIEILIAGDTDILAVNVLTNKHDQFPYAVGEGRQNRHMQFSPSWTLIIKGCQDYVDYLKNRRKESLSRTSGNIFIGDPACVDFEAFTDPDKDGLMIPLTEEGASSGKSIDQIIKQVPIQDTTARFHEEMLLWQQTAEQASGAHASTQGAKGQGDPTATEFVGTQQMAEGRISTIARLLSSSALVPQTSRIVQNLQQFLPDEITIRITGEPDSFDPDAKQERFKTVIRDASAFAPEPSEPDPVTGEVPPAGPPDPRAQMPDIQGSFDVVPHDGSLPGTDARKVAALSRAVEAYSGNPAFAEAFDRTRPGAIDPIKLFQKMLKATGFPSAGLIVNREEAMKNTQERMLAQGMGTGMPAVGGEIASTAPPIDPAMQAPSAEQLPTTPPATPPQARPENAV